MRCNNLNEYGIGASHLQSHLTYNFAIKVRRLLYCSGMPGGKIGTGDEAIS